MSRKLKNVTVTLDEETARWARVEAARRDMSVSRMLGALLRREMEGADTYAAARERYFGSSAGVHSEPGSSYPTREELHDRDGIR